MNTKKIIGYGLTVLVLLAFSALSLTGCGDGSIPPGWPGGDPYKGDPNSTTYTSYDGEGNSYQLVIKKGANSGGGNSGLNGTWRGYDSGATEDVTFNNGSFSSKVDDVDWFRGTYTTSGSNITITISEIYLTPTEAAALGAGAGWKTKTQLTQILNAAGASASEIAMYTAFYTTKTDAYTISGDTLTWGTVTYTRQSGRSAADLSLSSPDGRAAYSPKDGDTYTLNIKSANGQTIGTSTGIVAEVIVNGAVYTITLNHNTSNNTVNVTVSGGGITAFSHSISLDGGGTHAKPDGLTKTKPKPKPGASAKVWPDASILEEYGLSGLPVMSGTKGDSWGIMTSIGHPTLTISFTGSSASDSAVTSCFTTNGWTLDYTSDDYGYSYSYSKNGFEGGFYTRYSDGDCVIHIEKSSSEAVWPYSSYLQEYGLSGFSAPAGATNSDWMLIADDDGTMFGIIFSLPSPNDNAVTSRFTSNGWKSEATVNIPGIGVTYSYSKAGFSSGSCVRVDMDDRYTYTVGSVKK